MKQQNTDISHNIKIIMPGQFSVTEHYYQKVINAQLHPLLRYFFSLSQEQMVSRYCHLNPKSTAEQLMGWINYPVKYLKWAGADLFHVTTQGGNRKIIVIEVNSCPSGQKSMPLRDDQREQGGYEKVIQEVFVPEIKKINAKNIAVIYDKNEMEASGYAAALADVTGKKVYLIPFYDKEWSKLCQVSTHEKIKAYVEGEWIEIDAAFRYVTQKPWNRIPVTTKTKILNPVIACLAGGRNKLVAAKAYDIFNAELKSSGLKINTPHTLFDVHKMEIPLAIKSLGGRGVVKIPYNNAGQGVYTITNSKELELFMQKDFPYDQFIVQSLIGNSLWSSQSVDGPLYHVGTMPNKKNEIYVADLRFMVVSTEQGFMPVSLYARRAREPLPDQLTESVNSWNILGTNLSVKLGENKWSSDTDRLMLMDTRDFNKLGFGIDRLIDGYVQTILSIIAIDKMAENLLLPTGEFNRELYKSLNKDESFLNEIV